MHWIHVIQSGTGEAIKIFGGVVTALTVRNLVRSGWRSGPGKRRLWIRNYRQLGTGVRPGYVEQLFGQATFATIEPSQNFIADKEQWKDEWERNDPVTIRTWLLGEDGYLMTWSIDDEVLAYSITTASRRFQPKIQIGPRYNNNPSIHLGRTPFSALGEPRDWLCWSGAHNYAYVEEHYFGNPGNYRTWYCALSDVGYRKHRARPFNGSSQESTASTPGGAAQDAQSVLSAFRAGSSINSVLICSTKAAHWSWRTTGPHGTQVYPLHRWGLDDRIRRWRQNRSLKKHGRSLKRG